MKYLVLLLAVFVTFALPAAAEESALFQASGLPIPRFVSLRSEKVFVRSGPALRYPVKWVFQKKHLPVEVVQEFDTWRKIRDIDGEEGWIHQSLLAGGRTVIVDLRNAANITRGEAGMADMRRHPREDARLVARVEGLVVADLLSCTAAWCEIKAQGYRGWVQRKLLWGIYARENID